MKKMSSKKLWLAMFVLVPMFGMTLAGCAGLPFGQSGPPSSFQRGSGGETVILLRDGLEFDAAFREIVFVLSRHGFDPEMMQQEVGFIRSRWNYAWETVGGQVVEGYRVRVVANFNPSRTQLIINPEGEWLERGQWIRGFDTRAVETLRNDLTIIVGN